MPRLQRRRAPGPRPRQGDPRTDAATGHTATLLRASAEHPSVHHPSSRPHDLRSRDPGPSDLARVYNEWPNPGRVLQDEGRVSPKVVIGKAVDQTNLPNVLEPQSVLPARVTADAVSIDDVDLSILELL